MFRVLILLGAVLVSLLPTAAFATTPSAWIRVTGVEIDTRTAGSKTVDLRGIPGSFRGLRLKSDRPVTGLTVITRVLGEPRAELALALMPATPSGAIYTSDSASFVDGVDLSWKADPATGGLVKIEIWGHQTQVEAAAKRPPGAPGVRGVETAAKPVDAAPVPEPSPSKRSPAPSSRSVIIGAPPPPAPAPAPAPSAPVGAAQPDSTRGATTTTGGGGAAAGGSAVDVCTDQKICTIVDVYFGTTRKQTTGENRVTFGGERSSTLALGRAFVTVPRVKRLKGEIPRPSWWERMKGVPAAGNPAEHFTIPKDGITLYGSEESFVTAAKAHIAQAGDFKDHAFIYVHGYAVTFDNAVYRAAQMSYDLSDDGKPFGTAFVFSWPSVGKADFVSYNRDGDTTELAADQLRDFVKLVTERTGVKNVHIIAHSMGNRVLINALKNVVPVGGAALVNQIILAAPDVDKDVFENVAASVARAAKGMTLYASGSDYALVASRKLRGDLTPRAGEIRPPGPALAKGMDTIDITALSTAMFTWGHDTYADSAELLADIARVMKTGVRPPGVRNPSFKLLQQGAYQYWQYKG
jgi:esterase/lipase superfamily enzyme